jgi:RNA polymerase sigma factor for flagellar operon FliA
MSTMQGVESALIARHQGWVRQQARALARRLPSNVEQADLIQAGLIAVAQAALSFQWPSQAELARSEAVQAEFVRYARHRVRGAMLDELRQMDVLSRPQRRKVKAMQIARERWMQQHAAPMSLVALAEATGMSLQEVMWLEQADQLSRAPSESLELRAHAGPPVSRLMQAWAAYASAEDELEARVDTRLLLQKLEAFFNALPEAERELIDTHLGVGLSPLELARRQGLSRSALARRTAGVLAQAARFLTRSMGAPERASDALTGGGPAMALRLQQREQALAAEHRLMGAAHPPLPAPWSEMLADVLKPPPARVGGLLIPMPVVKRRAARKSGP